MVVGNHELDDGPEVLARFAAALDFPLLGANVDISAEPSLEGLILPHLLTNIGGETLGVIGVVTEETAELSRPGPTIGFLPIEATLERVASELEAQGVKRLIVLSHAGLARDRRVAAAVPGIDVIVGGHTNTLLSNSAAEADGPYPLVLTGPRGEPVLIVQAHIWGMVLGRLDIAFDAGGVLTSWGGDAILLDDDVPADEETAALVAELAEEIEAFTDVVVGETAVDLQGGEEVCRFAECNLGNLIADALLEAHPESEIALQNGGGIRASVPRGEVSVAQVLEVLPFGNTVSTFSLTGADVLATLEHGVSQAEDADNEGTGRFLQVAGLRYVFTTEAPPGERILQAEVREDDGSYRPIEPERIYHIVSNGFTRTGGDGFVVLHERAIDPYDQGRVVADVVQDHLMEHSPVSPRVEGRIVRRL
jgi:5'-nucleotidase